MDVIDNELGSSPMKDNSERARILQYIMWTLIAVNVISIISDYLNISFIEGYQQDIYVSDSEIDNNELREVITGFVLFGVNVLSIIYFTMWFYRGYANVFRLGVKNLKYSQKMGAWGFFIPIMSLYVPYRIAKDITFEFRRIIKRHFEDYNAHQSYSLHAWWWALYLISAIFSQIMFRLGRREWDLDGLIALSKAYMVSEFVDIILTLITIRFIKKLAEDEQLLYDLGDKVLTDQRMEALANEEALIEDQTNTETEL